MTPDEAIKILESLKDHINDDGKHEITAVQKAIEGWQWQPAHEPEETRPLEDLTPKPEPKLEEKLDPEIEPKPIKEKPWAPKNVRKTETKKMKKKK